MVLTVGREVGTTAGSGPMEDPKWPDCRPGSDIGFGIDSRTDWRGDILGAEGVWALQSVANIHIHHNQHRLLLDHSPGYIVGLRRHNQDMGFQQDKTVEMELDLEEVEEASYHTMAVVVVEHSAQEELAERGSLPMSGCKNLDAFGDLDLEHSDLKSAADSHVSLVVPEGVGVVLFEEK